MIIISKYCWHISAVIRFVKETFNCEITGKCSQFMAVPGCGLKCNVSHMESMINQIVRSEEFINYNNDLEYVAVIFF